jgi:penicillin-binding protein 1B
VIAIVGGRKASFEGFNRALDAKRSIGSLVKPVIYLAALETGRYHAASIIEDGPIEVKLSNNRTWRPQNISEEFYGPVPLVRALAQSLNLATVRLGMEVGLPQVSREFQRLGLEQAPPQLPSILLGAVDVSPFEVAHLYNSLANGGFNTPLRAVRAVLDAEGKPLKAFGLEVTPVAEPLAVYQVNRMLVEVINQGTGRGARAHLPADLVVAGKSGTSSEYRDSWFAGFSGSHSVVVWMGHDDNTPTGLTGSSGPLPVWSRVMSALGTSSWNAPLPEGLDERWIEFQTGLEARPGCGEQIISVPLPKNTELAAAPGCEVGVFEDLGDRARQWWRGITR